MSLFVAYDVAFLYVYVVCTENKRKYHISLVVFLYTITTTSQHCVASVYPRTILLYVRHIWLLALIMCFARLFVLLRLLKLWQIDLLSFAFLYSSFLMIHYFSTKNKSNSPSGGQYAITTQINTYNINFPMIIFSFLSVGVVYFNHPYVLLS